MSKSTVQRMRMNGGESQDCQQNTWNKVDSIGGQRHQGLIQKMEWQEWRISMMRTTQDTRRTAKKRTATMRTTQNTRETDRKRIQRHKRTRKTLNMLSMIISLRLYAVTKRMLTSHLSERKSILSE